MTTRKFLCSSAHASLQNEGFLTFCLCLTTWRHLGFTEKLQNLGGRQLSINSWGNTSDDDLSNAMTGESGGVKAVRGVQTGPGEN